MVATLIDPKETILDDIELSNLTSDLSHLATDIDRALRNTNELTQDEAQALLKQLNLIVSVYS